MIKSLKYTNLIKGQDLSSWKKTRQLRKLKKQIGRPNIIAYDPTTTLLNKFQKEQAKLSKERKFDNKTSSKFHSLDATPSRLYWVIKAHKPEKNYPTRTIVSKNGTALYDTSKYFLVEIIKLALNKTDTLSLIHTHWQEVKTLEIYQKTKSESQMTQ